MLVTMTKGKKLLRTNVSEVLSKASPSQKDKQSFKASFCNSFVPTFIIEQTRKKTKITENILRQSGHRKTLVYLEELYKSQDNTF